MQNHEIKFISFTINMQYNETFQVIIFLIFLCLLGYYLFTYMNDKSKMQEGFELIPSTSSSLPGGTVNASKYKNEIGQLIQTTKKQLFVTNNDALNQQYVQMYNNNLGDFKTLVNLVQTQVPFSIDFDASKNIVNSNIIEKMKLLNTLSDGIKNLDKINYKA